MHWMIITTKKKKKNSKVWSLLVCLRSSPKIMCFNERDRETVMIRWKKIPSLWPCDGAWIMMMMMMMARIQNVNKVQPKNGKKPASNYVTKKKIDFNFNFIFSSVVSIIIQIWFPWNLCAHDKATKKINERENVS